MIPVLRIGIYVCSKDDVTAFTSDIVKLLKVRCNFGSTGLNYEAQRNPKEKSTDLNGAKMGGNWNNPIPWPQSSLAVACPTENDR